MDSYGDGGRGGGEEEVEMHHAQPSPSSPLVSFSTNIHQRWEPSEMPEEDLAQPLPREVALR
jgi:hypothetical protein